MNLKFKQHSFLILLMTVVFGFTSNVFAQLIETKAGNYTTFEAAQSTQYSISGETDGLSVWALSTDGSTSQNSRAPSNYWKYQRTEYLITPAEMTASGFPSGSAINSIGFILSAAGTGTLSGTLNVYLMNTTDVTYTLGTSWTTTGFTQVSTNATFSIPITSGFYDIPFTGGSPFTWTGGGVYVAWEFSSPTGTIGTLPVTHYCNTSLQPGLYGNRSATSLPTTLVASNWRPATRFGTNDYNDVVAITNIYTQERVPVPFGVPSPINVRVSNVSAAPVTFNLTITVKDVATSTTRYTATLPVTGLTANTSSVVSFTGYSPTIQENVNITATTSVIPGEDWLVNNTLAIPANVNNNLFSYNFNTTGSGGYGYTYPGTGIFAAKYTMSGQGLINGANIVISDYAANTGNTVYAVALNSAGTIVAQSANYLIQVGDLGINKSFTFTSPAFFNNEIFYVGLVQTQGSAQYYPLGLFTETPQRGNTFYTFSISGGSSIVDNVDAKYGIEAQVTAFSGIANPILFTATPVSTTQIDLAFTRNASLNNVLIVWNNTGVFTTPTGTPPVAGQPFAGGTLLYNGAVSPINHTGLTPATAYYYKAFSYDGFGNYSPGLTQNTTTLCGLYTLPFSESFDPVLFPPSCWTRINAGSGNNWARSAVNTYSGNGTMYYPYSGSSPANSWMITPGFALQSGKKYYVSFYQNTAGGSNYPEKMKVTVGNAPNVAAQTTVIWDNAGGTNLSNTTYELRLAEFNCTSSGTYYFGFNVYSDADMWNLYVDEIAIYEQPGIDLAFTNFIQTSGLPVPRGNQNFSDYTVTMNKQTIVDGKKQFVDLSKESQGVKSSNVNNTVLVTDGNALSTDALGTINLQAEISNFGASTASYLLNWNVNGSSQTPYSGPTVNPGSTNLANLSYTPTAEGTFITSGSITVTGDEVAGNNTNQFRMRVYPDSYTRTIYDRGDNTVDTYIGWGDELIQFKAGVRFTATSEYQLAGVDFICRTETVTSGNIIVQVRGAGTTTTAPGAVLYTQVYNAASYLASGEAGDYIFFPFDNTAPTIASGSDYWITIKMPLGILFPGAAHATGFTPGRSFFESNTDTTLWNPLVLALDEYAWIMRSVNLSSAPTTFALSVLINNGWNMVSIPGLHPTNQNVTTWWSGKDPAAGVFKFSGGYQAVTTAVPGTGYWMKNLGTNTYNTGDEWPAGGIQIVAHNPITAATGWNLFGGYETTVATSGLTTTPAGLITGSVFKYSLGYTVATTIVPGYGYWVKLTGSGSINIPVALAKGNENPNELIKSDWGKITITDALGRNYVLYAVNGGMDLNSFELPPAPPAGMFDVRFGSDRYADEISDMKSILMSGLENPITIRVENIDLRVQDETGAVVNTVLKAGEEIQISNANVSKLMVSGTTVPLTYSLEQNYPNPFNPSTKIEFSLPEDVNNATLIIYNVLGQKVTELVNGKLNAGKYSYLWNAGDVTTGLYIYELRTDNFVSVKKMLLIK